MLLLSELVMHMTATCHALQSLLDDWIIGHDDAAESEFWAPDAVAGEKSLLATIFGS